MGRAFNDGTCKKCKRRIGWVGEVTDKPACPSCGHKPDAKEMESLKEDQKSMEEMTRLLLRKHEHTEEELE